MNSAFKRMVSPLRTAANRFVNPTVASDPPTYIAPPDSIFYKAATFVAINKVKGDYLEFGVFRGASYVTAYHTLLHCFGKVISDFGFTMSESDRLATFALSKEMRFFAFDSFAGLPESSEIDNSGFFEKGQFSASLDVFRNTLHAASFPMERSIVVEGWYDKSLTAAIYAEHGLTKASIIHIDCDLYESTKMVLDFVTPLLVDGTVLIFDDWFHFKGHPQRGEQRAFNEWTKRLPRWSFSHFQQEGTWRMSFIASEN